MQIDWTAFKWLTRALSLCAIVTFGSSSAIAQSSPTPFCIAPINGGTPTESDFNNAFRMVLSRRIVPGLPRPILYNNATPRKGVWTIDDTRSFVPFGGEFPSSEYYDLIARNPETGRVLALNTFSSASGIFFLDPGDTQFKKLDLQEIKRPTLIEYIPRYKAFVVASATGLYRIEEDFAISHLSISDDTIFGVPSRVFDLPAFNALVFAGPERSVVIRYDNGEVQKIATIERRFDFLNGIEVESDGRLAVRSRFAATQHVTLANRKPSQPIEQGRSFIATNGNIAMSFKQLHATSIDKTLEMDRQHGIVELTPSGPRRISLPFDPAQELLVGLTEIPEFGAVFIVTRSSLYFMQKDGPVSERLGARAAGSGALPLVAMIPERKEVIYLGRNSLSLLVDRRISGESVCSGTHE